MVQDNISIFQLLRDPGLLDVPQPFDRILSIAIGVIFVFSLAIIFWIVAKVIVNRIIRRFIQHVTFKWARIFYDRGILKILIRMAPAVALFLLPLVVNASAWFTELVERAIRIYLIIVVALFISSLINGLHDIYAPKTKRPLKQYMQVTHITVFIIAVIGCILILFNRSIGALIGGIGALSAVLLLVFKDTLLGFTAGISISANHLASVGDWIEVSKHGIDGEVIDISLQTVKVMNWDKTVISIPIYALISDSFKNWRTMQDAGGRRIKRSVSIDMRSVKFCTKEMLERYRRYLLVRDYVDNKEIEITSYNKSMNIAVDDLLNGRQQTNLGIFRAYMITYLRHHQNLRQDMTTMVRQLAPTSKGVPIEIYAFSQKTDWVDYEGVQADIFDHLLAAIGLFDLEIFQDISANSRISA